VADDERDCSTFGCGVRGLAAEETAVRPQPGERERRRLFQDLPPT
jgi:hypothetical protein